MRDEGRLAKGLAKEAGEGWSYPFWSKACDLFVYLNVRFRSFQFEEEEEQEVPSTFVANIHQARVAVLHLERHLRDPYVVIRHPDTTARNPVGPL